MNVLMMTSTKGHFDRKDIYKKTFEDFGSQTEDCMITSKIVHIKVSPGDEDLALEMEKNLYENGATKVLSTFGLWKHGDQSHHNEYIRDISRSIELLCKSNNDDPTLFLEDDWLIRSMVKESTVTEWLIESAILLTRKPELVQVRIPRFNNEFERINRLKFKHGINASATEVPNEFYFTANDWSNNPFIARTRDMYLALCLMRKFPNSFPAHAEHGFGAAMKFLSLSNEPLAIIKPSNCRCFHMGTKIGEEDKLDKELNSD